MNENEIDWDQLSTSDEARQAVLANVPEEIDDTQREQVERAVSEAFDAIASRDAARLTSATLRLASELPPRSQQTSSEGARRMDWLGCESRCLRHLDDGRADSYAVCYWACIIRS